MSQPSFNADTILNAVDLQHEDVIVPEWGVTLRMQQLGADEMAKFTADMHTVSGEENGMYVMIIHCARVPETNERVFTMDHLPALRNKNFQVLNRVQAIALRLNKMGKEGEAALKKD